MSRQQNSPFPDKYHYHDMESNGDYLSCPIRILPCHPPPVPYLMSTGICKLHHLPTSTILWRPIFSNNVFFRAHKHTTTLLNYLSPDHSTSLPIPCPTASYMVPPKDTTRGMVEIPKRQPCTTFIYHMVRVALQEYPNAGCGVVKKTNFLVRLNVLLHTIWYRCIGRYLGPIARIHFPRAS